MTSTELVHVPRTTTVYDSASPLYRFLHRQISRVRAVLALRRPVREWCGAGLARRSPGGRCSWSCA